MKRLIGFFIGLVFLNIGCAQGGLESAPRYAVLVPMQDESLGLLARIKDKKNKVIDGVHYIEGTFNKEAIVFAYTGLGKADVSVITARLIQDYHPAFIFLSGSAGNINPLLSHHSVVVGARLIDADLGTLSEKGPTYPYEEYFSTPQKGNARIPKSYSPSSKLLGVAQLVKKSSSKKIVLGSIATSDVLPNSRSQTKLLLLNKIDAVEMEGASFMQACWLFDKECIVVRGLSNNVDQLITKKDTIQAGDNAGYVVLEMIKVLGAAV